MSHPETMSMPRPCSGCGGQLQRITVNPDMPLGMVVCSDCTYQSPIGLYTKSVRTDVMNRALARKAQG